MSATFLVVFATSLLVAVLVSEVVHRTVLSTAVLFLVVGFLVGDGMLGLVTISPTDPVAFYVAEIALFSVLFTDGMRVGLKDITDAWHLPGRALLLGLPLTVAFTAVLAVVVAGLPWPDALLLGAVLSPTDPLFAAAIVGREDIPWRLRHLLNVESGLNDGLALPLVIILLAVAGLPWTDALLVGAVLSPTDPLFAAAIVGREDIPWRLRRLLNIESGLNDGLALPLVIILLGVAGSDGADQGAGGLAWQIALGILVGVAVPWVAIRLERTPLFSAAETHQPLGVVAVGLLVLGICLLTHANLFLAAFCAGVTIATMSPASRDSFQRFGELITELLKLTALLMFGALITPGLLAGIPPSGYVFAVLALLAVRPAALAIALRGSGMPRLEWAAAAWFGPKGFASVVFGLIVLGAGLPQSEQLFRLIALVVVASIVAHSSTDVLVAHAFRRAEARDHSAG